MTDGVDGRGVGTGDWFDGHLDAAAAVAGLPATVEPDGWGVPATAEWDVRALAGHTARARTGVRSPLPRARG